MPEIKQTPLTIIDPVQKERNAAAAISKEKKEQAKKIAEEFLNNPSKKFFTEKKVTWKEIKKHNVIIEVIPLKGNKDVVGTKILKVYERIRDELNQQEFKIKSSGWIWEKKAYLYYDVKGILSKQELREGPPTTHKENVRAFKKKHKHTCIQKGRIYARENREYTKAKYLVKALMKNPEIKKRVETIRIL